MHVCIRILKIGWEIARPNAILYEFHMYREGLLQNITHAERKSMKNIKKSNTTKIISKHEHLHETISASIFFLFLFATLLIRFIFLEVCRTEISFNNALGQL